jgi:hypothetical protein
MGDAKGWIALAIVVVVGCGGGSSQPAAAPTCLPGEQRECACPGGTKSVQVCAQDGKSLGPCDCPDAGGFDDAASDGGGTDAGGIPGCTRLTFDAGMQDPCSIALRPPVAYDCPGGPSVATHAYGCIIPNPDTAPTLNCCDQ